MLLHYKSARLLHNFPRKLIKQYFQTRYSANPGILKIRLCWQRYSKINYQALFLLQIMESWSSEKLLEIKVISGKQPTARSHFRRLIKAEGTLPYIAPPPIQSQWYPFTGNQPCNRYDFSWNENPHCFHFFLSSNDTNQIIPLNRGEKATKCPGYKSTWWPVNKESVITQLNEVCQLPIGNCGKYWRFWEQKLSESPEKFENIPNLRIAFPLLGIISSVSNQYLAQRIEVLCFFEQAKNYVWTVQWNPHQDEHTILLPVELLLARTVEQFQAWLLSWTDTVQWPYHATYHNSLCP